MHKPHPVNWKARMIWLTKYGKENVHTHIQSEHACYARPHGHMLGVVTKLTGRNFYQRHFIASSSRRTFLFSRPIQMQGLHALVMYFEKMSA